MRPQGPATIKTLWPTTVDFIYSQPEKLSQRTCIGAMVPDYSMAEADRNTALQTTYDTCHFWSNFEIGR